MLVEIKGVDQVILIVKQSRSRERRHKVAVENTNAAFVEIKVAAFLNELGHHIGICISETSRLRGLELRLRTLWAPLEVFGSQGFAHKHRQTRHRRRICL